MCLLIVLHQVFDEAPLIVAANRDEFYSRPAEPMIVHQKENPRILGGKDKQAGGTWLAINEGGLFAGLTNHPSPSRNPNKKSRGQLPLALAGSANAERAVSDFCQKFRVQDFNPCRLLVGDRQNLYYIDMTQGAQPKTRKLGPGLHILENCALEENSPKTLQVRDLLGEIQRLNPDNAISSLRAILGNHRLSGDDQRPTSSACVHHGNYGTRTSVLVQIAKKDMQKPDIMFSDGPLCRNKLQSATPLWLEKSNTTNL